MLTVLFLQAWQAPYAVHQRIAGLCVLHKSLSNMKVHRYDIDFFFGCFKDMQQKLRMQILSNALPEILGV
jgi:ABC-type antimicrobial peptide transport system permease subunit